MTLSALHGIKITLIKKYPVRVLNIVPKIVRFLIKNLSQNRQNFDEIVVFSAGSENPSVLWCTRIFRFSEKLKKALIFAVF